MRHISLSNATLPLLCALSGLAVACAAPVGGDDIAASTMAQAGGGLNCASIMIGRHVCDESWWDAWVNCTCTEHVRILGIHDDSSGFYDDCYDSYWGVNESYCGELDSAQQTEQMLCEQGYTDPTWCRQHGYATPRTTEPDDTSGGGGGGDTTGDTTGGDVPERPRAGARTGKGGRLRLRRL